MDFNKLDINRKHSHAARVLQVYEYFDGVTEFIHDQFDMDSGKINF